VNSRHIYHTTDKSNLEWNFVQKNHGKAITIDSSDSLSSLILSSSSDGTFVEESWWVEKIFFRADASRSESNTEDVYRPGYFRFLIPANEKKRFCIVAMAGKNSEQVKKHFSSFDASIERVEKLCAEEISRRKELIAQFKQHNAGLVLEDWLKWIVQAADSFVVSRASTGKMSVIAGYHWFDDWGRDSLISLPGLTLVTGRFETAKEILLTFQQNCNKGVIPNRFSDKAGDIPLYNTVDATLWFFNAILQYLKYTGDFSFVQKKLWNTLKEIMDYHTTGTIFGIHMDKDGLIMHGPQLTWMDATTVDGFVTPRDGKAVEVQALWYNALQIMELLAKRFNQHQQVDFYHRISEKVKFSFNSKFWNQDGYLNDVLTKDGADSSFRPNQLIATSLDFSMLENQKKRLVVEAVRSRLWGEFGLKTLPDNDPRFMGKYLGDWKHRDTAYHNGTVWAWLLGPFVTGLLKTKDYEEIWRKFAFKNFLKPLFQTQLSQAGLGTISEIFDGDSPHLPQGCISQAWSVAEPLRAYVEDVVLNRPPKEKDILAAFLIKD
jgi:predicted glycogen debranching enzyme